MRSATSKMKPKFHIFSNYSVNDYDNFDVTNASFILYSERTDTSYPIDGDEVIKLMNDPDVELSTRAKDQIDRLLKAAFAA